MISDSEKVKKLLEYGKNFANEDEFLEQDAKDCPISFVLCCLANKNVDAKKIRRLHDEVTTIIPFSTMVGYSQQQWSSILKESGYTRYNKVAGEFVEAIKLINTKYEGHAEKIWKESNSFAEIVSKFLEFKGISIKIATMTANLLNRHFDVNFKDKYFIDISPDTHVKKVFYALNFVDEANKDNEYLIICKARALYPKAPYMLDNPCYHIGKDYCRKKPKNPRCDEGCPIKDCCIIYEKEHKNK